jgi:hypothetical protein
MPKGLSEAVNRRRTYNTMAKRYQRGNQKPYIEEGHTIRCPIIYTYEIGNVVAGSVNVYFSNIVR